MQEITVAELAASDRPIVDVREQWEWDEAHAGPAVHIPLGEIVERVGEVPDDAAVICKSGGRSARVVAYLESVGRSAVNVAGGTDAWIAAGLPTERA